MEHLLFLLINMAAFFLILFVDRKKWKYYLMLCAFTLVAAAVFENYTTFIGLWFYHSEPKLLFQSFYTWLMYIPYISLCYFAANRVREHV